MSHTPGPWRAVKNPMRETGYFVLAGEAKDESSMSATIARHSISHGQFDSEADARLVAAAPALLEALRQILDGTEGIPSDYQDAAYAAIAKAEGR